MEEFHLWVLLSQQIHLKHAYTTERVYLLQSRERLVTLHMDGRAALITSLGMGTWDQTLPYVDSLSICSSTLLAVDLVVCWSHVFS